MAQIERLRHSRVSLLDFGFFKILDLLLMDQLKVRNLFSLLDIDNFCILSLKLMTLLLLNFPNVVEVLH
jgi:hypothetical protein